MTLGTPLTEPPTLQLNRLNVRIPVGGNPATVIHDVSLSISKGKTVGLVGESGSGKSMTARAIMRMLAPRAQVSGEVKFEGKSVYDFTSSELRSYRGRDVAMIYQNPHAHINPVRTIGDFLTEALRYHDHLSSADAERRVVKLLADVGIPDGECRLQQFPHQLSGGLLQRVMIVACLAAEPRLLLADEPTTALDVTTQEEVMAILADVKVNRDLAVLLVTHDLDLAAAASDQIAVMYAGMIVEIANAQSLAQEPMHPYTVGLLAARPSLSTRARLKTIPGRPASGFEVGHACVFAERCPFATPICHDVRPSLEEIGGHLVACHRARELKGAMEYPVSETD